MQAEIVLVRGRGGLLALALAAPFDRSPEDRENLQPEHLTVRLGSPDWMGMLGAKGYAPGQVIGVYHVVPSGPDPKTLIPLFLYVAENARRQGIATALCDAVRAQLEAGQRIGDPPVITQEAAAFRDVYRASRLKL